MDHSDSDSSESWTLLDPTQAHTDAVADYADISSLAGRKNSKETNDEKDEDTDGISIISDSEAESTILHEINEGRCSEEHQADIEQPLMPEKSAYIDDTVYEEAMNCGFLGDSNSKHKTYVHKRNKRLSTVLNIIVLGSVITTAGVAIGHMWGAKNDCTVNKIPSVNKILSNLYKLQEENAYLRSKLKEFQMNHINVNRRKSGTETNSFRQNKCKKIFEDSINNINSNKPIKCVDNEEISKMDIHLIGSDSKNNFIRDIDKLKDVYNQNKSWLDYEIVKRYNIERQNSAENKDKHVENKLDDQKYLKGDVINEISATDSKDMLSLNNKYETANAIPPEKKINYRNSLKSDVQLNITPRADLNITTKKPKMKTRNHETMDIDKNFDTISGYSVSEDELKKDNRYVEQKHKKERKKYDRQKLYKKQKRKNKYEQWEMKGGYLRDYEDSISSQENEYILNLASKSIKEENYIDPDDKIDQTLLKFDPYSSKIESKAEKKGNIGRNVENKEKYVTWFENRAVLRSQARKKLEQALFGETSANKAGWYFRRMHRREQCRAKGDNSTHRKLLKRNMNFKMKH